LPNPTKGDVHVNAPLTNISVAYIQNATNFISARVFPIVPVQKQSNLYFIYDQADFYRVEAKLRGPGTESAGGGFRLSNTSYLCDVNAIHKDVDDQTRANQDAPISLDRDATNYVTQQCLLKREVDWASGYFTTGIWTGSTTGSDITPAALWDTVAGAPINDIGDQVISIAQKTGNRPNKLALGAQVYHELKNHPDILDRVKYVGKTVTPEILAGLFDVDEVLVMWGTQNTANEALDASYSFIGGKNALLVYAAPNPGIMVPTGGYTFAWTGLFGTGADGMRITTLRMEHLKSDRIEGEMAYDHKVVGANLGVFFSSVVS
jgi:hypothetical protein